MYRQEYFYWQACLIAISQEVSLMPLKELQEEMEAAKLLLPIQDIEAYHKEKHLIQAYIELAGALREYQATAKIILQRVQP